MTFVIRILFVIGIACAIIGGKDAQLAFSGTKEPEQVTLAALGAPDGTTNCHLTVTQFQFGEGVVFEEEKSGKWKQIWIPLVQAGEQWTERPIVVNSLDVSGVGALDSFVLKNKLTGVITGGLGKKQANQFKSMYPNTRIDDAMVLNLNKSYPSPVISVGVLAIGIVMMLVAAGLFFGIFERKEPQTQQVMATDDSSGSAWAEAPQDTEDDRHRS